MKKGCKYLLRFDDICPNMKWTIWDEVVEIMDQYGIKPIIAVVPDNHDWELNCEPAREDFWQKVKDWQKKGWTVALHGYHHIYENSKGGILKVNDYSEFAGVDYETQMKRITKGLGILKENGIRCKTWIAPAHSFDKNTVRCLKNTEISVISDGYSNDTFYKYGMLWVPCQLYKFVEKDKGVWTVCKHPNMWDEAELEAFRHEIEVWHEKIVTLEDVFCFQDENHIFQNTVQWFISSLRCRKNYCTRKLKKMIQKGKPNMLKKLAVKVYRSCKGNYIARSRRRVKIGSDCRLNDYPRWGSEPWLITIGNHVEISLNVTFLTHDGATWCFREQERYRNVIRYGKINILDNCFIGANSTILPNVTIGPNAVIGAGSVVTKDVPPDSVYAGNPARYICSLEEYAEKCRRETPDYNKEAYDKDKKAEVLRVLQ